MNSKRVILKSTSNFGLSYLTGKEGTLSIGQDGLFRFQFLDDQGQLRTLQSGIQTQLGSLDHPASKEICFQTKNSTYVFEKKEKELSLWGAERNQLSLPEISYEDYNSLRNTVMELRRGNNQGLTMQEQGTILKRWEKVNLDIHDGKTTILPPKVREHSGIER